MLRIRNYIVNTAAFGEVGRFFMARSRFFVSFI